MFVWIIWLHAARLEMIKTLYWWKEGQLNWCIKFLSTIYAIILHIRIKTRVLLAGIGKPFVISTCSKCFIKPIPSLFLHVIYNRGAHIFGAEKKEASNLELVGLLWHCTPSMLMERIELDLCFNTRCCPYISIKCIPRKSNSLIVFHFYQFNELSIILKTLHHKTCVCCLLFVYHWWC